MKNKNLSNVYITSILAIIIFVIIGEVLVQNTLKNQENDSHIINIAGRQRMLSQKIVKIVLLMERTEDFAEFHQQQKKLSETFILWRKSHQKLIKGNNINSPSPENNQNSLTIQKMFFELNIYQTKIKNAVESIIWLKWKNKEKIILPLQIILANEELFLAKMNSITFQYDKEAKDKIDNLRLVVLWIAIIIVVLILILILFFFRPVSKHLNNYLEEIENKNQELLRANDLLSKAREEQNELIKQLKTTQEELLQNNEEMKSIQDSLEKQQIILTMAEKVTKIASYEYDLEQHQFKYSENLPKIYGLDKNTLMDVNTLSSLGYPEDKIDINKELSIALVHNKRVIEKTYKAKHKKKDSWHYYKLLGRIIFDEYDEAIKVLGSIQDITQSIENQIKLQKSKSKLEVSEKAIRKTYEKQKQFEKELKIAFSKNQAITDALDKSALVSITDLEGNIIKVNKIFCEVSGYTENELLGKSHNIINSNYHPESFWVEMWKTISKGKTWRSEVKNKNKDGSFYWVDTVINPIRDDDNMIYQYLSIRYLITDKKKNQELITRLSLVAKEISNAVTITNANGLITWVNNSFINMTGYHLDEILGKKPGSFLQGESTNLKHIKKIKEGLKSLKPFTQEILNYDKTGQTYWVELRITPVFNKNNELEQFIAIEIDITERKKQELLIKNQNRKLKDNQKLLTKQNNELSIQKQILLEKEEELLVLNTSLTENIKHLQLITTELTQSIHVALTIQNALLPSEKKMQKYLGKYFLVYKPKNIVSGDFYWLHDVNEMIILVIGDCTGHGVPGAFMTLIGTTLLNKIIRTEKNTNPSKILQRLHEQIKLILKQRVTKNNSGMDVSIITLKKAENNTKITFAGAKHDLLYIEKGKNKIQKIKGTRKSIGGIQNEQKQFKNQIITLPKDSMVYLGSDGLSDQNDSKRRKIGTIELESYLEKNAKLPLSNQQNKILELLEKHMSGTQQRDDILWMGIKTDNTYY